MLTKHLPLQRWQYNDPIDTSMLDSTMDDSIIDAQQYTTLKVQSNNPSSDPILVYDKYSGKDLLVKVTTSTTTITINIIQDIYINTII